MTFSSAFYAIVDPLAGHEPVALAEIFLARGVRLLQLRLKRVEGGEFLAVATRIAELSRLAGALFIVNDRLDIALLSGAGGVHLGQTDLPLAAARRLAPTDFVIGISTHDLAQARAAEAGGADYIGFGPIYPGGAKRTVAGQGLERLREIRQAVGLPIVAIGGIVEATLPAVIAAGASAGAMISDVVNAPDLDAKVARLLSIR
ncbi:MAG TPA: thiamine phosphate synthase [Candidatus Binataceae bacterium]|nr:thiamine phosphate synthase [Candidatus Binataceae bacterium]